ncbi:hypothetical protein JDV02_001179 [Purpureocillium takamizusanense]|uniref:Trafficking protein particle complex II-specific subunit 65 IgD3 domain-containing protein n=1 Tax=Purpureocillium takamizusanense TaxID=2060973 RepID=A0A9Q8Q892_9HYPO|nr:uncharacterized protein JDV02_001179 [Purpureocillium takamizusanense]UNI14562.1 hypothetical protein JDV02_001179 [Purpureocillium takamizusanense]
MSDNDAVAGPEDLTSASEAQEPALSFVDNSYLSYMIPRKTDLDLDSVVEEAHKLGKPILESMKARDALYFDETVTVLLILKCPILGEEELAAQVHRLVVSLDVQIVNTSAPGRESPPAAESIFTGHVADVDDAFIAAEEHGVSDDGAPEKHAYAMWKMPVFLARPRMRPHRPSVVFSASASIKPEVAGELSARGTGYLQSGLPMSFNLLESFAGDPALKGVTPRLSALRVSRVAPVTRQQDLMTHVRSLPQLKLSISPVIHTRIRFSRPSTVPLSSAVVALLEVDFTPNFDCEALLDEIKLETPDGTVVSLSDSTAMKLPLSCVAHDHITFLYHIKPHHIESAPKPVTGALDISISASVLVEPGLCVPRLSMAWSTTLDFTVPVNPNFGPAAETGIQRSHRPAQLSIGSGTVMTPLKSPSVTQPDALPALEASTTRTEASLPDLGITMSFTGPSEPVRAGDIFSWAVYVVNRTAEKTSRPPRKLALVAIPKRRRNDSRPVRPPSTASRRQGEKEVADAVLDENVLHAMQKSSVVDTIDLVCLSSDTRVGPLAPGACHVVELQFLALREGVVAVDAIRVVDLGSQEHVDIRDLPTMLVEPAAA